MYVCLCRGLKESDVRQAAREGHTSAGELISRLGLNDPRCCGRCARNADHFVLLALDECGRTAGQPAG